LEFNKIIFSEGPDYDVTTGTFTCVIPGVYIFSVSLLSFPTKYIQAVIVRNGNTLANIYSHNDTQFGPGFNMAIVRLEVGDRVWVQNFGDEHISGTILHAPFTTFSGFLLNV